MSKEKTKVGGVFKFEQLRDGKVIDKWFEHNIVVAEGLRYILDAALNNGSGVSVIPSFYVSLFKNNYTPTASDSAGGATPFADAAQAGEVTAEVSEATRQPWALPATPATTQTLSNSASPASYTFISATAVTINGAFLISENTKGGTTGILISASKFTTSRTLQQNDILKVTYEINASS